MSWSKIKDLGSLSISTGIKVGSFVDCQRAWDETGTIQLSVTDFTSITGGTLYLTGRPHPGVNECILHQEDLTALTANSKIVSDVPLMPQMRITMIGGASSPTDAVNVRLME